MNEARPCTNIYYEKNRRTFLVFPMGMRSSGQTLIDRAVEITEEEFDSRIAAALAKALDSYQIRISPDQVWRPPEGVGFIRKNLCVSVERLESGDLDVQPLHHERGGYVGNEGEHIIVPAADISAKIASILRDAFTVAS